MTTTFGAPCWVDLTTPDADAARAFYPALFGWTAGEAAAEFGGYFMFTEKGAPLAGAMPWADAPAATWTTYLAVADADKTAAAAEAEGGSVVVAPMPVADLGISAVLQDPAGSRIGLWEPRAFAGFGPWPGDGVASYFELYTPDYERDLGFYRAVFGWATQAVSDSPQFRYTQPVADGTPFAGVMEVPADGPSGWTVYFGTPDAEGVVARVAALGGTVLRPAEDTPYGRIAHVADPGGAAFKLIAANDRMPAR